MKSPPAPLQSRWLGVAFTVAVVAFVGGVAGAAFAIRRAARLSEGVNTAFLVLERIDAVQTRLAEVAASQRAYLITRDPAFLNRYRRNETAVREAAREFLGIVRSPVQAGRAAVVEERVYRRIELAERAIASAQAGPQGESLSNLIRQGTEIADGIRAALHDARIEQEDQLRAQIASHQRTSLASICAVAVTGVAALLALAIALATIRRDLARRRQAESAEHAALSRATAAERQVAAIVDSLSVGFIAVDPQSRISVVNPAAASLLGRSVHALLGSDVADACPEALGALFRAALDPAHSSAPHVVERRFADSGRWLRIGAYPVGDDRSRAIFLEDVTELRAAHERSRELLDRLAETHNLLHAIFEGSRDLIGAVDRDFRLTACNPAYAAEFQRIFGRPIAIGEEVPASLADLAEEQEKVRAIWRRAMAGESFSVLQEFGSPAIDRRWYEIRYDAIRNSRGEIVGASHIIRDVTERIAEEARLLASKAFLEQLVEDRTGDLQQALDRLQVSERRWSTLVEAAPLIVWNADAAGVVQYCNSRWYEYTGAPAGPPSEGLSDYVHSDDRARRADVWSRAIADASPYEAEYRLLRADGAYRWHLARGVPLRGPDGALVGWFGVSVDIEDQKRAQELLRDAHARLESLVAERTAELRVSLREKEVLLQEVHHRVKNNLQIVSSLLSLQADTAPDSAARGMLDESCQRVLSMALIHENLYRAGDLSRVQLNSYIDQVAHNLIGSYGPPGGGVSYVLEQDRPILLALDRAIPCGLILNELLSNALKHAFPGRGGTIRVRLESSGSVLRLTVADDGVGLPAEFDPAAQRSLGLQIVGTLVRQLRGALTARNNGGAEFTVEFPEALPSASARPAAAASR